jgi:hypothetical protein
MLNSWRNDGNSKLSAGACLREHTERQCYLFVLCGCETWSACLPVCLPACLPVCLSVCLPVCMSACLSVCMSVCLSVCLSACLPACLPVCLFVCLPACLSACRSVCVSVCLSACLPVCLPVCLSVCLPVCLSACHSEELSVTGTVVQVRVLSHALTSVTAVGNSPGVRTGYRQITVWSFVAEPSRWPILRWQDNACRRSLQCKRNNVFRWDTVRPPVAYYQRLNHLSDFRKIRSFVEQGGVWCKSAHLRA